MPSERVDEALERRSRYLRAVREKRSVDERLAEFAKLQQASFRLLRESPDGYRHFLCRNMASRRVEVIDGVWQPVSPARRAQQP